MRKTNISEIKLKARAKINLSLDVTGKRSDGYHNLSMIMQSINLYDCVTIKKNHQKKITLSTAGIPVSCGKDNLAYQAAAVFFNEYFLNEGVDIHIEKKIPLGSGLAGGSADAAAVLIGLSRLFGQKTPMTEIMELGSKLGADIPFAMIGGTALAEGIGETITPLPFFPLNILVVKPPRSMSSKYVYQHLNLLDMGERPDNHFLIQYIEKGDLMNFSSHMRNVLESVTKKEIEEIDQIKKEMISYGGLGSMMSGSGSSVFGIFLNREQLNGASLKFLKKYDQVFETCSSKKGVEII